MSEEELPAIRMNLSWDDEADVFIISYLEGERSIFQVKMSPENFEMLTADMVKTVKNYNLFQAQVYLEKKKNEENQVREGENYAIGTNDPKSGSTVPDSSAPDQPSEAQPEQPPCNPE